MKGSQLATRLLIVFFLIEGCNKEPNPVNSPQPPPASKGTLSGAGGNCLGNTLHGFYIKGAALDTSNYLTVTVNVIATGSYTIISDTINGFYFTSTGLFSSAGTNSVKLKGNGRPLLAGIHIFSVQYDNSKCNFEAVTIDSSNKIGTTVFIGSSDGVLYALDALSGNVKWKFQTSGIIINTPTVVGELVIFGSADRNLYAVNAITGLLEWNFYTGDFLTGGNIQVAPAASNGTIYFSCENGKIYAIDTAVQIFGGVKYPTQKWQSIYGNAGGASNSAPTIANGLVFAGASDNTFSAFDAQTGVVKWRYNINDASNRSNPVVVNDVVYLSTQNSTMYSLNAITGGLLWQQTTDNNLGAGAFFSSPTVSNNTVYVASTFSGAGTNQICAMDITTGAIKWYSDPVPTASGLIIGGPIVSNGLLYGASDNAYLYAWDATSGSLKWKYNTGDTHIYTSPAIANNLVYIASENGTVYALDAVTGLLKWKNKITSDRTVGSSPCVVDLEGVVHHPGDSGEQN